MEDKRKVGLRSPVLALSFHVKHCEPAVSLEEIRLAYSWGMRDGEQPRMTECRLDQIGDHPLDEWLQWYLHIAHCQKGPLSGRRRWRIGENRIASVEVPEIDKKNEIWPIRPQGGK
ncbi:hypothetical protein BDZ89DRAFT_1037977 [Hymenopellis radicata]|nr:hypothetical protein BDZ89DRAFT_1037977 [Hymenopellis radicata]